MSYLVEAAGVGPAPDDCQGQGHLVLDPATANTVAATLKALADPVRLHILAYIGSRECTTVCACHLPAALGIRQPTLSHHLHILVDAGLIARERRGRWAHYRLEPAALDTVRAVLFPPDRRCC